MAKHIIISPIGGDTDALFLSIREFQTEEVILVVEQEDAREAESVKKDLERFRIPVVIQRLKGPVWEEIFRVIHDIAYHYTGESELILNVASGRGMMNCAATSAAFVNGVKAFSINDKGELLLLPVLKFSYYTLLSDRKMKLLTLLAAKDCCSSLEELGKKASMSLSLVSYHINGNLKSDGLKQLGLIETKEVGGRIHVELTMLGRLLLKGYV